MTTKVNVKVNCHELLLFSYNDNHILNPYSHNVVTLGRIFSLKLINTTFIAAMFTNKNTQRYEGHQVRL